jgi:hypothetical protein
MRKTIQTQNNQSRSSGNKNRSESRSWDQSHNTGRDRKSSTHQGDKFVSFKDQSL